MKLNRNKYRKQYKKWHQSYEKRANTEIKRVFKEWVNNIDWNNMTAGTISLYLNNAFNEENMIVAMIRIYREIGIVHGKRIGTEINQQLKKFSISEFLTYFERVVREFVREFNRQKVRAIKKSFIEQILKDIKINLDNGKPLDEVLKESRKKITKNAYYEWRALRIARTESTAASNYAAIQSAKVSGFEMQKEWISAIDKRTRRKPEDEFDHVEMDGKKVGLEEQFVFNGGEDVIDFPGDPKGDLSNIINCRCAIAIVPKRDKEGNLIPI